MRHLTLSLGEREYSSLSLRERARERECRVWLCHDDKIPLNPPLPKGEASKPETSTDLIKLNLVQIETHSIVCLVFAVHPELVEGLPASGSTGSPRTVKLTTVFKFDAVYQKTLFLIASLIAILRPLHLAAV